MEDTLEQAFIEHPVLDLGRRLFGDQAEEKDVIVERRRGVAAVQLCFRHNEPDRLALDNKGKINLVVPHKMLARPAIILLELVREAHSFPVGPGVAPVLHMPGIQDELVCFRVGDVISA